MCANIVSMFGTNYPEMRKERKEFQHEHQLSSLASVYNSNNIKIS